MVKKLCAKGDAGRILEKRSSLRSAGRHQSMNAIGTALSQTTTHEEQRERCSALPMQLSGLHRQTVTN